MVALDLDSPLKGLFQHVVRCLENVPKPQGDNVSSLECNLSVSNSFPVIVLILICIWFLLVVVSLQSEPSNIPLILSFIAATRSWFEGKVF